MSTYVIGDIQGCYQSFRNLLNKIKFSTYSDHLVLAGDLINRGPQSLETMEYVLSNRTSIRCVLGNHDLHFLAVAQHCKESNSKDTFDDILDSNFLDQIVTWFSNQPLAIYLRQFNTLISHAGIPPNWSVNQAVKYSSEVSQVLQSSARYQFFVSMYGNQPDKWSDSLLGLDRLRYITNAFTRMRFIQHDGRLELNVKTAPDKQNSDLIPWFKSKHLQKDSHVAFGHWASLQGRSRLANIHALDTGCVWGGELTALRLDDFRRYSVPAA
ncbi:MAG: symmetrical bis(5'-nucleosyl)-tetraphosphatase [Kangiellaceae bacterium]|nr:symmetrical bis(5'-nucleosyl)-tetraphosphatase [Kangiellaceae bacterium]